jgi:hypothetical protein
MPLARRASSTSVPSISNFIKAFESIQATITALAFFEVSLTRRRRHGSGV